MRDAGQWRCGWPGWEGFREGCGVGPPGVAQIGGWGRVLTADAFSDTRRAKSCPSSHLDREERQGRQG